MMADSDWDEHRRPGPFKPVNGCPFCGGADTHMTHSRRGEWFVACDDPACATIGPTRYTPNEALDAWNTRAADVDPPLPFHELRE